MHKIWFVNDSLANYYKKLSYSKETVQLLGDIEMRVLRGGYSGYAAMAESRRVLAFGRDIRP